MNKIIRSRDYRNISVDPKRMHEDRAESNEINRQYNLGYLLYEFRKCDFKYIDVQAGVGSGLRVQRKRAELGAAQRPRAAAQTVQQHTTYHSTLTRPTKLTLPLTFLITHTKQDIHIQVSWARSALAAARVRGAEASADGGRARAALAVCRGTSAGASATAWHRRRVQANKPNTTSSTALHNVTSALS
ncbi:jg16234 [Pararge aegeria aegeria]|uniref:Jg16234 protein n=1 Tax=Pararge aegeria aegeria TaxID=348720 RepID=A0A8S4S1S7_9NEOP|nr:jg16234 [Pararge aegeria aegeria]